jgi:hypothetical protein
MLLSSYPTTADTEEADAASRTARRDHFWEKIVETMFE